MCEHKNLRTVGDRLFCKDCKEELPIEFLTGGNKPEEPAKEAPQGEQETGGNAPVGGEPANDTPKKKPAKTGRKTAKKGE